jgi:hypothetical protein
MDKLVTPVTIIHNSGILLQLLYKMKETDFSELQLVSGLDDPNFYMAVGYLAKETNILFIEGKNGISLRLAE